MISLLRSIGRLYRNAFRGLPREVWLLSAGLLVNRAGTMVLPFLALYATEHLGWTKGQAGWLLASFGLGALVGSYLGGRASDRFGAVPVQIATLLGSGIGFLSLIGIREQESLLAAVFVVSAISEAFRPACMTAAVHASPAEIRTRSLALVRLAANFGMALGPTLGGLLAGFGYHWLFVGDALSCWLAAGLLWTTLRGARHSAPGSAASGDPRGGALQDLPFLGLLAVTFFMATALLQFSGTLPVYLHEAFALEERHIGLVLGLNAFLIVLLEMPLVSILQHRNHLHLVGVGCFLLCAGFALMPFGSGLPFLALTVFVWTLGEMICLPFTNSLVAARAGARAGSYMGFYTATFSAAFLIAPLIGFGIYSRFGPEVLWYGIGGLGPLLWIASLLLQRSFRPLPQEPATIVQRSA